MLLKAPERRVAGERGARRPGTTSYGTMIVNATSSAGSAEVVAPRL